MVMALAKAQDAEEIKGNVDHSGKGDLDQFKENLKHSVHSGAIKMARGAYQYARAVVGD